MRIFVTGGTGQTGPAIVTELVGSGHGVVGLARSTEAAERLHAMGAESVRGTVEDLDVLRGSAAEVDGVVHLAFGGNFGHPGAAVERELAAVGALGDGLTRGGSDGAGRPFVTTSGTLVMRAGSVSAETDAVDDDSAAALRIPGERAVLALAERGIRACVVRLAPTVHGPADHGFVPMLVETARRTGVSAYVGDGSQRWPAVHRLDAADLYRLAVESAPAGSALHGVGEQGVPLGEVAVAIGEGLGLPVRSIGPDEAAEHFQNAFMAGLYGTDAPASSEITQELLGWSPTHWTLLQDLRDGDYLRRRG